MIVLKFHDQLKFKDQLKNLEYQHSIGNYLRWCPERGCDTLVFVDDDLFEIIYKYMPETFQDLKIRLYALAEEAGFHLSFCRITRPIQIKRYLNGKPKGKPRCDTVHFTKTRDLLKLMLTCSYDNYINNIIH